MARWAVDLGSEPLRVLTAMITPAVLISACGTLLFSTSARLGRVVDRVRVLADRIEHLDEAPHPDGGRRDFLLDQLTQLSSRALLLRSAMTTLYVAIGLFVATSLAVAVVALASGRFGWLAVAAGLGGAGFLLHGSVLLIREARLGVDSTLQEMAYVRDRAVRPPSDGR